MSGKSALELFSEAVRATFLRWTALNLAVSYQWGDGNESHKREDLIQQTISGFATAKRAPDPTELEGFLDNYLQDQFNLSADDESPYEVSILICRLYELIVAGRLEEAQHMLSTPVASLDACVGQPGEEDTVIDGDDSGDSDDDMMDDADAVPREEEKVELTEDQQADLDDGWGVVVKSNKGRVKQVMPGQGG
eukprot:CAMPEP_0173101638 /NCGR_PEP_ID=MMETSP1102-20130122/36991_1 /TAXON_ID=49646 /ORGANISM="Geminigera sp., Strain Caron Lab Isolate" /LENGTH=192 /DNA_ID=CAMNT_0013995455 /DNA_START=77 /DNA_END=651 /DNA_ORIENTATION=-